MSKKERKEEILSYLKKHSNEEKKYNVRELQTEMNAELGLNMGYNVVLKWVMVLGAESESGIIILDYGNRKEVYYDRTREGKE